MTYPTFIYFLLDTPSGNAYYTDETGTVLVSPITAGMIDYSLKHSPGNWLETTLEFMRNSTYEGIFRSFTTPMDFVLSVKTMIENLILKGAGTEVPLSLAIYKYNSQPQAGEPIYQLYYKGNLDIAKLESVVLEGLSIPLQEGGMAQLLKNYENTVLQIPCDGSIAENIKVNLDGYLKADTFFYQFVPGVIVQNDGAINNFMPIIYSNNLNENYGIVHGSPSLLQTNTLIKQDSDYIFYSTKAITIKIKGYIVLDTTANNEPANNYEIQVRILALKSTSDGVFSNILHLINTERFSSSSRFDFEADIDLKANEKLSIVLLPAQDAPVFHEYNVQGGFLQIDFVSKPNDTRAWGVSMYDLFTLQVAEICRIASTAGQNFNYKFKSDLLQQYLNILVTSGDALRASGDANYQKYFYLTEQNTIGYGPVIKATIKQSFECVTALLCAVLGTEYADNNDQLFIETRASVYDSSVNSFDIGEVANFRWKFIEDLFTDLKIGYAPQTYDQIDGKYEPNTTLWMRSPVKGIEQKIKELISPFRADTTGIERLRTPLDTAANTSTTRNDSDSGVFIIDIDRSRAPIDDYFAAQFVSQQPDISLPNDTNIHFATGYTNQHVNMPITDGEYLQPNTDNGIIVFSKAGYSATENCNLTISGVINSTNRPPLAPVDQVKITLWHNGVALLTSTTLVTGINTPIAINYNFTELFAYKDSVYITIETTVTCEARITTASLSIGTYLTTTAVNIPVLTGTAMRLLSWQTFTPSSSPYNGLSVVQTGFQYFVFNSILANSEFILSLGVIGYADSQNANFVMEIYVNGVLQADFIFVAGTISRAEFVKSIFLAARTYAINDIVFVTASPLGSDLQVQLITSTLQLTSTFIKAYYLFREQYDSLTGIPNVATIGGDFRTDIPGAPYNIRFSPKTMYMAQKYGGRIKSQYLDQVTGDDTFQTLSKNPYMSRSIGGVTITENANETILDGLRLTYPLSAKIKTNVPIPFASLCSSAKNLHITGSYMGWPFGFFIKPGGSISAKPALNESQDWDIILSAETDLSIFANITGFRIPDMAANTLAAPFLSSIKWVPFDEPVNPLYHTRHRDKFLFKDQISLWLNRDNYGIPVQIGDPINQQFISWALAPINYIVYRCEDDSIYTGPQNLNTVAADAVQDPYTLWQMRIDTSAWQRGNYYFVVRDGGGNPLLKSEPLLVRPYDEMEGTLLIEGFASHNTQGWVFQSADPMGPVKRIFGGMDNTWKQKYIGKVYIDQPQDITMLNGIAYEEIDLFWGRGEGVPDYEAKNMLRLLLLDQTRIEGELMTLSQDAEMESVFTKGAPMKFWRTTVRPGKNKTGIVVTAAGAEGKSSIVGQINANTLGPNVSNESGTTDVDILDILIEE